MSKEIIFSFSGGMFPYYLGIASVLQTYDLSDVVFSCTSGGCFAPLLLNSKRDIQTTLDAVMEIMKTENKSWEDIINQFLVNELTEDDVHANNDKLMIKLTKLDKYFMPEKAVVKKWDNKEDMAKCVAVACFVPLLCGNKFFTEYKGNRVLDGFFSGTSTTPVTSLPSMYFSVYKWRSLNPINMLPSDDKAWMRSIFELGVLDANENLGEIEAFLTQHKENATENVDPVRATE